VGLELVTVLKKLKIQKMLFNLITKNNGNAGIPFKKTFSRDSFGRVYFLNIHTYKKNNCS